MGMAQAEILADTGSIHNEDHAHLLDADIRVTCVSSSAAEAVRMLKKRDTATGGSVRMLVSSREAEKGRCAAGEYGRLICWFTDLLFRIKPFCELGLAQ